MKYYYCQSCAMQYRLPLSGPDLDGSVAGFCYICGVADVYAGFMKKEELEKLGVEEFAYPEEA